LLSRKFGYSSENGQNVGRLINLFCVGHFDEKMVFTRKLSNSLDTKRSFRRSTSGAFFNVASM
jgi:hypothetical protein